ncbi:anti-sigma factor [Kribbella sp. ALI-6-A]|uniref:zf-HC2 domain-containing protein n=1 Tax=Kribbella sp. ALI-6-A TaxID=1933817 RepID=UPI00097CB1B8|nr:zf-HC2 domain-containing protein [Kribbella sp. ALI-6-A]ONI77527.1 anti-sigma factor [Kribbella sp. ALI-6-A]
MSTNDAGHDRSQLGAYALGALEPDEAREVELHLAGCAECRTEVAELEEMKQFLDEIPPEAFLDGPPADGDLLLQRTLRAAREAAVEPATVAPAASMPPRRSRWLLAAAAAVVVAGALGGGVVIGRQSVDQAVYEETPAGSKQATATDAVTGTTMATTVQPRGSWSWVVVDLKGLKTGAECQLLVTDTSGKTWVAGSWVVSERAARDGARFSGGVLVPPDRVGSVEIRTVQGERVVTTQL